MEHIFVESTILLSFVEEQLTSEYILANYQYIIPEFATIETFDKLKNDFMFLYNGQLHNIINLEDILIILHKYKINKYYKIMIENAIWNILRLTYKPMFVCSEIIHDILNHNIDFDDSLCYLLEDILTTRQIRNLTCTHQIPDINKCTFSVPLLESILANDKINTKNYINLFLPIKYDLLDVIEYLILHNLCDTNLLCEIAAQCGQFNILKFGYSKGYNLKNVCTYAVIGGHIDILKWARENGCPWDETTIVSAIKNGHLDVTKFILEQECLYKGNICNCAITFGQLEMLIWLQSEGYKTDEFSGVIAAGNGQLNILKYLWSNGHPFNLNACYDHSYTHNEVRKWLQTMF